MRHLQLVKPLPVPSPAPVTPPADEVAVSLPEFRAAFEKLLDDFGVTPNFAGEYTEKTAPAMLALTLAVFGAAVDMPTSLFEVYERVRQQIGARSLSEARPVYPAAESGGAS